MRPFFEAAIGIATWRMRYICGNAPIFSSCNWHCHWINFCLPFGPLGLHFGSQNPLREPCGPRLRQAHQKPNNKSRFRAPFWSTFGPQRRLQMRRVSNVCFGTLSGQVFESIGPPFRELLAIIFYTLWDQRGKVKTVLSLQSEPS